jgi:2-methylcitrate dehydratase PrpD
MSNVSRIVAEFVTSHGYEELPRTATHAAARVTLDAIGVMAAASGASLDVQPFVAHSRAIGGQGRSTLIGYGDRLTAPAAAFANGAMAHALDFEDVFDAAPCHPNASAIPAGLAIAQHLSPVHGRRFLAAIVVGCEVVCRLALSTGRSLDRSAWYPPPILGAPGAAIAVAKLLADSTDNIIDTISLLLMQLSAPGEIRHSSETSLRATREAFPAQSAVVAGMLATGGARGFTDPLGGAGGYLRLFAGGDFDATVLLDALGVRYDIEALSFKQWPTCRGTHAAIDMALRLVQEGRLRWQDVASVELVVSDLQKMLAQPVERKRAPQTLIDAKFSLPFSVATALVKGAVTLDELREPLLQDVDVLAMARRISVEVRAEDPADPTSADSMRVVLASGEIIERTHRLVGADNREQIGDDALFDKFVDCCARAARPPSETVVREVGQRLLALDAEPDVGSLLVKLFPPS